MLSDVHAVQVWQNFDPAKLPPYYVSMQKGSCSHTGQVAIVNYTNMNIMKQDENFDKY